MTDTRRQVIKASPALVPCSPLPRQLLPLLLLLHLHGPSHCNLIISPAIIHPASAEAVLSAAVSRAAAAAAGEGEGISASSRSIRSSRLPLPLSVTDVGDHQVYQKLLARRSKRTGK